MTPKRLAYFLCTAVTILALIGFMGDVFSLDSLFGKKIFHNNRFSFTMGGPNRAAFYLSASMLILMGLMVTRKKLCIRKDIFFAYIPMAFMLFSLILTAEKKSIFLLPLFVVLFVLFSKKYKILLLMLILGTSVLYTMDIPTRLHVSKLSKKSSTVSARLNAWKISSRLIEKKPIIGNGYASFRKKSGDYFKKNKATFSFQKYKPLYCAHNINLNTLVETGLLGLIAINAIFFISVITTFRSTTPKDFSFYIALIIVFIYLESQVGSFIRSFHRTNYTFLLMGICAGMYSKTYRGTWIKQFNQFQFFPKFLKGKGQTV
jgi:O-antigen ligase